MITKVLPVALLSVGLASHANADAYIFGNIGMSKFDVGSAPAGFSVDDQDVATEIGIGYELNDTLALEVGYASLGETSVSTVGTQSGTVYGSTVSVNGKIAVDSKGFTFGVRGNAPLNDNLKMYGRLGLYNWTTDVSISGTTTINGTTYTGSASGEADDGTDFYFGAGAEYDLSDKFAITAGWTRFAPTVLSEDVNVDTFYLGGVLKF